MGVFCLKKTNLEKKSERGKKQSNLGISDSTHEFFPQPTTKHHGLFTTFREGHFAVPWGVGALRRFVGLSVGQRVAFPANALGFFFWAGNKIPGAKRSFWSNNLGKN